MKEADSEGKRLFSNHWDRLMNSHHALHPEGFATEHGIVAIDKKRLTLAGLVLAGTAAAIGYAGVGASKDSTVRTKCIEIVDDEGRTQMKIGIGASEPGAPGIAIMSSSGAELFSLVVSGETVDLKAGNMYGEDQSGVWILSSKNDARVGIVVGSQKVTIAADKSASVIWQRKADGSFEDLHRSDQ